MFLLNLKTFFKHLAKSKLYLVITVLGFTISLTFVILLSVYINNELSVNRSQTNRNRIYRLRNEKFSNVSPPIGRMLQNEIPEIESFTRIYDGTGVITTPEGSKIAFDYLMADSSFFKIFTLPLVEGNAEDALKTKNSMVLTQSLAHKLFGNKSPIGKQIMVDLKHPCTVTAVVKDISKGTHFNKYDAILNFKFLADIWENPTLMENYGICSFDLYLLAKPNTNLPAKIPQIKERFLKDFWIYRKKLVKEVIPEPLSETYFSTIEGRGIKQNSKTFILVLLAIVVMILILSIINYMNLTIARSGMRVKELAIKKLMGSSRGRLIVQQIVESVILCAVSFGLALLFGFLAEPVFNRLLNTQLNLNNEFSGKMILLLILMVILIGFISGIIPAVIITRLKAVEVLKGGFRRKTKSVYSKILIGFQYVVVIVLLISTFVIYNQTKFMLNHNPGFSSDNILMLDNSLKPEQYAGLKNKLLSIPGVKDVSFTKGTPVDGGNNNTFVYHDKPVSLQFFVVDSSFFKRLNLHVEPTNAAYSKKGIWLNRTGLKTLELPASPPPASVVIQKNTIPVLGVVDDFNFRSLREKIGPVMIELMDSTDYAWSILVQLDGKTAITTADKVKKAYSDYINNIPFSSQFLDESIQKWYENEKRTSKIVGYFAFLTIVISVMGIFAMSMFYNQQRTKEIGIRKVNGATVSEIVMLLNKDFVKWVIVAFFVATPVAWYAMNRWLENFAYKIELSWWIFAFAGITALAIAMLTVSWHTFRAARQNPVEALRYE